MLITDVCMIRSNRKQMAQAQGEHILQIMHCWHYGYKLLIKSMKLNDTSCRLIKGMVLQADAYDTDLNGWS